jgi:translocation and assembly module TamB|uniref:translocation/assembly module TamB domain-containing protein n=1 Tax=Cyanobium sp. TaxID=2164130 RepID=UPI004049E7D8
MGATAVAVGAVAVGLGFGHWALDRTLHRVYAHWKPVLDRQVSRVMGHPFDLGPYQGLGWGGLRVGATRLAPGRWDGSSLTASGAAVSLDPLASLRQGFPVVQISLEGVRADLKPNRQGQWWVLGPGVGQGPPPRLELRFRLRQRAQVFLSKSPTPLGLDGRLAIQVHRRALQLQTRLTPPGAPGPAGSAGSLALNASGRWDRRDWRGELRLDHLALAAVQQAVGGTLQANPGQWSGRADGRLDWSWQAGRPSCQGGVRLNSVGWRPSPQGQSLVVSQLMARCRGQQVSIQPTPWQWQWQSQKLKGDASLRAHWQGGKSQGGQLRVDQIQLRLGSSWLRLAGRLGPQLDWQGRWQVNPRDLRPDQPLPPWLTRDALAGTLRLSGTAAKPVLVVQAAQRSNPIVGPWQASLRWQDQVLELQGLQSPQLQAKGSLPLALLPGRGLVPGELDLQASLERYPLARLSPVVAAPLGGVLSGQGRVRGPLSALTPEFQLRLDQPVAGPLGLDESWVGEWFGDAAGGGRLRMEPLAPAPAGLLTAQLDRRWVPIAVNLQRGAGSLSLQGKPRLYQWTAKDLPLADLWLAVGAKRRPQFVQGDLTGRGQLSFQPLAFRGVARLDRPVFLGIWARSAAIQGHYANRRFQALGSINPLDGGALTVDWRGAWQGPLRAKVQARQLSDSFLRQLVAAWPQWQGLGPARSGRASDIGLLVIDSLGKTLQQQLALLASAKQGVAAALQQEQLSRTPRQRLEAIGGQIDADLSLAGPSLAEARADLAAKAHLWTTTQDRDSALTEQPIVVSFQGPLSQGDGQFSISSLPLSLIALLTPLPVGLRGSLQAEGRYGLGRRRPQFSLTLGLSDASLGSTDLDLQKGSVTLQGNRLVLDLALHGAGVKNTLDLAGTIPLDPAEQGLELRLASRDDGLVFLTSLAEPSVDWKRGRLDLQLLVRGSQQEPIANGFFRVQGAELLCFGQRVEAVDALALFDFQQLVLQNFSARVGSTGLITAQGSLGLLHPIAPNPQQATAPGIRITVKAVPFILPRIKALANGEVAIGGSLNAMTMGGQLAISKGSINVAPSEMAPAARAGKPVASVADLLEERWTFEQPLVLLGPDVPSLSSEAVRDLVPRFPALGFQDLRFSLGPDLTVGVPNLASFATEGSLRLNGRLDPSLTASGVVKLKRGRLNLFTTTFSLDPDTPNVAVFTPSMGLIPYLDIALRTRVSDSLRVPGNTLGSPLGPSLTDFATQGSLSSLDQLNLVRVYISVSGPADQLASNLRLRSSPPLSEERLLALIGGNSLAGLAAGQAGAALATALGQTLLSPVLGTLSDALGQRVSFALFPTFANSTVSSTNAQRSGRLPTQLVLGSELGLDITERFNASVLAAPNRSDIPPQLNLNYKASELINLQGTIDSQGALGAQLQLFLRF